MAVDRYVLSSCAKYIVWIPRIIMDVGYCQDKSGEKEENEC